MLNGNDSIDTIQRAISKARETKQKYIACITQKIEKIDPLAFYRVAQKRYNGQRFYWENKDHDVVLAGIGAALSINAGRTLKYEQLKDEWAYIQNHAVISGIKGKQATGLLLFGGFSFDDKTTPSDHWQSFGFGLFYLPTFLLTTDKEQSYLTCSVVCTADDKPELLSNHLAEQVEQLFGAKTDFTTDQNPLITTQDQNAEEWKRLVGEAVKVMETTDLQKVVLARTRKLTFQKPMHSEDLLSNLREQQPETCVFSMEAGTSCFLGATPERLVKKSGNHLYSACLAGSIARGKDDDEDARFGEILLNDRKNRLEHHYVVDTVRSALAGLCEQLNIPEQPILMKNRNIQHLYTPVDGVCDPNRSLFDLIERLHPTPALGGLPRTSAMDWIAKHEKLDRGLYASPIGWCDGYGNGEFHVGIRSALINSERVTLFAGCGVVRDSVPAQEYEETSIKFQPMMNVFAGRKS
ncbi:isochorismate synthase MenF [Sporolactobacillus kofuensis]|uniref:isochorismate synthase n=1 Tax=Sporolactobacillus kofuensis TaxID=269672 RepID=A0ABW1WEE7_9BACL|nr:isochorismate synthase [Sporolactobacillus kofuensis]